MIELDREVDLETVERVQARPLVAFANFNGLAYTHEPLGRIKLLNTRRLQQKYKRPGAAVHDRQLVAGELDNRVINAQTGQRRHEMFDRLDPHAILDQRSGKCRLTNRRSGCIDIDRRAQVGTPKHDPTTGSGRSQRHVDLFTRVQTDAGSTDRIFERALS